MTDSLFADVSEFQVPVDDSYPYEILSIRSNDGTYEDHNFAQNYRWATAAADSGRLACFIVYFYWRPNWLQTVQTHRRMVEELGGPHPKMITMIDLESGGNPRGDQSDGVNRSYWYCADWLGDRRRVIGYANRPDFDSMWNDRPALLRIVGAGYGRNPLLPGQIAHQYTDGQGFGGGLPEGAPPFGNCDMNAVNGLSPQEFAAACGVGTTSTTGGFLMALSDEQQDKLYQMTQDIWDQLRGKEGKGWPQLGQNAEGQDLTLIDAVAEIKEEVDQLAQGQGAAPADGAKGAAK